MTAQQYERDLADNLQSLSNCFGTIDQGTPGLIELTAPADGYVSLSAPRAATGIEASLPVVVAGLKPRWSTWLWQKQGYNGAQYYGGSVDRVRPLGIVREGTSAGTVYFSLYTSQADHDVIAGHPVIANDVNLFINAVATAADGQGRPTGWHVTVNNPTDHLITATLQAGIPNLPGLNFTNKTLPLQPGQLISRDPSGVWTDVISGDVIP